MENSNIGRGQASSVNLPENQTCALSGTGAHSAGRIQGRPLTSGSPCAGRGWEIAGMFAKTSPPQTFVSNIAQGLRLSGTGHSNPRMPNAPIGETLERIAEFSCISPASCPCLFRMPILDWTSGLPKMEGSISLSATVAINGMVSWRLAWERHGRTRIGINGFCPPSLR